MKKMILLAVMAVFVMMSCNSNGEIALDGKDDYTFTTTLTMTCSPNITGYPQTSTSVSTKTGITVAQAKAAAASLNNTTTTTSGGYKFTSTWKCVYVLTKDYVPPAGERVVI